MSNPNSQRRKAPNNLKELQAHQEGVNAWVGLDELLAECNALRTSPSHALLLLRNKPLIAAAVKDGKGLLAAAEVLDADIKTYKGKLDVIYQKHVDLVKAQQGRASVEGGDVLAGILAVAEEYSEWMTSYQLVVIPSAYSVTSFFDPELAKSVLPATPQLSTI